MGIKGVTDTHTKVSTVGKIRTGIKVKKEGKKDYPEEVPYFVLNALSEVEDKRGNPVIDPKTKRPMVEINDSIQLAIDKLGTDKPNKLTIMFPMDPLDSEDLFVSAYMKWWGNGTLKCIGDGEFAHYKGNEKVVGLNTKDVIRRPITTLGWETNRICNADACPQAISGICKAETNIRFILPDVSEMKVFQLDSKSRQVVEEIFGDLKLLKSQLQKAGYKNLAGVPLTMYRELRKNNKGLNGGTGRNYIVKLAFDDTRFEQEKTKQIETGRSLLSYGAFGNGEVPLLSVDPIKHDQPNYDLLPQSEHGRMQTGDVEVLPAETDAKPEEWIKDPEIKQKFKALGEIMNTQVTKAKMLARARNHPDIQDLHSYLDSKLGEGVAQEGAQA